MPTVEVPLKVAQTGVGVMTGQSTTIVVRLASIEILIGGPYRKSSGEMATYGHTALRVTTNGTDLVYDFGRYAGETGPYGEGRLRIWSSFNAYIASENRYGRQTTAFVYEVTEDAAERINAYYNQLVAGRPVLKNPPGMREYRLAQDYHALNNNCATMSFSGARLAIPDLERDVPNHSQGRGMSFSEKMLAKAAGWPDRIFMPADVDAMLRANTVRPPKKITTYGGPPK